MFITSWQVVRESREKKESEREREREGEREKPRVSSARTVV